MSLFFACVQLAEDPSALSGPTEVFQITPLFVLPVLLYVALHDRATITFRRGLIERRGALGWTTRAVLEGPCECVIRPAASPRRNESLAGLPFAVEVRYGEGKIWLARVSGEAAARELASRVNELLAEVNS